MTRIHEVPDGPPVGAAVTGRRRRDPEAAVDEVSSYRPLVTRTRVEQNPLGDLVVPVENGEIVSLPRLWDFDLTSTTRGGATLTTTTGLIAVIRIDADSVTVGEVSQQVDSHREIIT